MVIGLISSTLYRYTSIIERGVDRNTFNVKFRPTLYSMAWYCFKFQGYGWLLFSLYVWPADSRQAGVNTIMSSKILRCMLLSSKNKQMLIETRNHFKKICEVFDFFSYNDISEYLKFCYKWVFGGNINQKLEWWMMGYKWDKAWMVIKAFVGAKKYLRALWGDGAP